MPVQFSILIATYNRLEYIDELLESWLLLEPPQGGYEIILADDGSINSPETIVQPYLNRLPLRFIKLQHRGLSSTRQCALEIAQGQYVLFTDDDCRPSPGLLRHYEQALASSPDHAMGGPVVNLLTDNIYSETTQAIMTYITETWNSRGKGAAFFTASNLLFPREKLVELGGFDTTWLGTGEDRDLCLRWGEHGLPMKEVPQAIVGHAHHLNFRSFLRQHFNYGRGRWWCEQRRTKPDTGPPGWSGLPFYFKLVLYPLGRFPFLKSVAMCFLSACSQLATAAGYYKGKFSG